MAPFMIVVTVIGSLLSLAIGWWLMWRMADKAQQTHPHARVEVPETVLAHAENDLVAWAQKYGYRWQPSLVDKIMCYRKGRGWLTSATEIRWHGNGQMDVDEVVNLIFTARRFALNAPSLLGQPIRIHKLKAVNKLLAQWQLPPLAIESKQWKVKK